MGIKIIDQSYFKLHSTSEFSIKKCKSFTTSVEVWIVGKIFENNFDVLSLQTQITLLTEFIKGSNLSSVSNLTIQLMPSESFLYQVI